MRAESSSETIGGELLARCPGLDWSGMILGGTKVLRDPRVAGEHNAGTLISANPKSIFLDDQNAPSIGAL